MKTSIHIMLMSFLSCALLLRLPAQSGSQGTRPMSPDSLNDFQTFKDPKMYMQYIGQDIYYRPISESYLHAKNGGRWDTMVTFMHVPEEVEIKEAKMSTQDKMLGKKPLRSDFYHPKIIATDAVGGSGSYDVYTATSEMENCRYTITDVKGMSGWNSKSKPLSEFNANSSPDWLEFWLTKQPTNDVVIWRFEASKINQGPFIPRAYYKKFEFTYVNKELIAAKDLGEAYDQVNDRPIKILKGSKWKFEKIFFYSSPSFKYEMLSGILSGEGGSKIIAPKDQFTNKDFILPQEYAAMEEKRLAEEKTKNDLIAQEKAERKADSTAGRKECVARYGAKNCELIYKGAVKIGMTKDMCLLSRGQPKDVRKTTSADGPAETWYYHEHLILHFQNEKLIAITE